MGASPVHILRIACSSAWELASSRAGRGGRRRRRRRRRGGHGTLTTVRTYVRSHRVCSLKGGEGGGRPFWRREQRPKSLAAAKPKNGEWEEKGVRRPDGRSVVGSPPLCTQGPAKKEKGNLLCGQARRDEETDFIGTPFSPSPVESTCLAWAVVLFLGGEERERK